MIRHGGLTWWNIWFNWSVIINYCLNSFPWKEVRQFFMALRNRALYEYQIGETFWIHSVETFKMCKQKSSASSHLFKGQVIDGGTVPGLYCSLISNFSWFLFWTFIEVYIGVAGAIYWKRLEFHRKLSSMRQCNFVWFLVFMYSEHSAALKDSCESPNIFFQFK